MHKHAFQIGHHFCVPIILVIGMTNRECPRVRQMTARCQQTEVLQTTAGRGPRRRPLYRKAASFKSCKSSQVLTQPSLSRNNGRGGVICPTQSKNKPYTEILFLGLFILNVLLFNMQPTVKGTVIDLGFNVIFFNHLTYPVN